MNMNLPSIVIHHAMPSIIYMDYCMHCEWRIFISSLRIVVIEEMGSLPKHIPSSSSSLMVFLLVTTLLLIVYQSICSATPKDFYSKWSFSSMSSTISKLGSPSSNSSSPATSTSEQATTSGSSASNCSFPNVVLSTSESSSLSLLVEEDKEEKTTAAKAGMITNLEKIEMRLAGARFRIRQGSVARNSTLTYDDHGYIPRGPIYKNANAFHRSYLEMEKLFKIYIYEEGEPPIFHNGPCKSIYSTEGLFINELEGRSRYITRNPDEALVYFLPFSVVMMVHYLYKINSHEIHAIEGTVVDYIDVIANKHPYWNRSIGSDHFMLSCHDWGPRVSSSVPNLCNNSIRAFCNANKSEGFKPSKDVSFPEIHLRTGEIKGLIGGPSPSSRPVLAFFAGRLHGNIRYLLLQKWKDRNDPDMQVYDQLPDGISYDSMLKRSRFCLCPSGYEVASPRVVEAIYAECVPVLISDSYVPPFSDVLNWKAFSVQISVEDIPNIKRILMGISQSQYLRMHRRVKQVQRHFAVNRPAKQFDVFHMTLHSIWLRRLNIRIQG